MNIEDLNKLEEKVNSMVNSLRQLKIENEKLKSEIIQLRKESTFNMAERDKITEKVASLIALIESIES